MIRLEGIALRYGPSGAAGRAGTPEVLRDLDLAIPGGAFRWLLGPSGAGKSSLLQLLHLSIRPTSGRMTVLGADIEAGASHRRLAMLRRRLPLVRRRIGMVFQDYRLLGGLSAFDNVALPLRLAGRPEAEIADDVDEMLAWVGLRGRAGERPASLSGGEQQRVAVARAVIARPSLLLADEPTGNLDARQSDRLMSLFEEMNRLGATVIVATHNESLLARRPGPTLVLERGRLVEDA
jgi:cell division transport system ATP-binding protein